MTRLPESSRQGSRRRLDQQNQSLQDQQSSLDIRYLSLGGASTWGVGLESPKPIITLDWAGNPSPNMHEAAYPYRLSIGVHNAAQRIGGPTMAALCTQSLVEERIYDVVTVEFSNAYGTSDLNAMEWLVRRLRRRFPKAVIVLVQLWSPAHFFYWDGDRAMDFASWRGTQNNKDTTDWNGTDWQGLLSEHDWKYLPLVARATLQLETLSKEIEGYFVHLAPPKDPIRGLETANKWFLEMGSGSNANVSRREYTLSTRGHLVVANHIRSFVDQEGIPEKSAQERNDLGDWGSGDACHLWYDNDPNNDQTLTSIPTHSSNLKVTELSRGSSALELSIQGGSLVVQNPFLEVRTLHLTYMVDASPSGRKIYPRVQIWVDENKTIVIDPHVDEERPVDQFPCTRSTAIGVVAANSYVEIRLKPLEDTTSPFQLIGASFLAEDEAALHLEADFDLLMTAKEI